MVFSSPLLFIEVQYYSDHPEECILLFPSNFTPDVDPRSTSPDSDQKLASLGFFALEVGLSKYYPLQCDGKNESISAGTLSTTLQWGTRTGPHLARAPW